MAVKITQQTSPPFSWELHDDAGTRLAIYVTRDEATESAKRGIDIIRRENAEASAALEKIMGLDKPPIEVVVKKLPIEAASKKPA